MHQRCRLRIVASLPFLLLVGNQACYSTPGLSSRPRNWCTTGQQFLPGSAAQFLEVIQVGKASDVVTIGQEGQLIVVDVVCPSGIGSAAIALKQGRWPDRLTIRFRYDQQRPFANLEGLQCTLSAAADPGGGSKVAWWIHRRAEHIEAELILDSQHTAADRLFLRWVDVYR